MGSWNAIGPWDEVAYVQSGKDLRVFGLWNPSLPL